MNMKRWQKAGILCGLLMTGGRCIVSAQTIVLPLDIKFDLNRAAIKPGERNDAEFKKLTQELDNYPYAKVEIEGYADSTGPADSNQKLSEERAQAVRQRFIDHYGVNAERIKAVGFGETKPAASNETAAGRTQNRRVIARIIRLEAENTQSNGNHL